MSDLQVEATGETVGEAKWAALRELEKRQPGLDKASVSFQVVSEGERGLLGVGYAPARVLASVAPDAPAGDRSDESELAAEVRSLVERIVSGIGVEARVDVHEDDEALTVSVQRWPVACDRVGEVGGRSELAAIGADLHFRGPRGEPASDR